MGHAQTVYNFPTLDATMKLVVDEIEHYDGEYEADTTSLEWDLSLIFLVRPLYETSFESVVSNF